MTITGDCDDSSGEQAADRLDPFKHAPVGDKYLAYVIGAHHKTVGGNGLAKPDFPHPDLVPWIHMAGLAFVDSYVKNCPMAKAWLRTPNLSTISAGKATMLWKLQTSEYTSIPVSVCADPDIAPP
jgi:hypothetical protein